MPFPHKFKSTDAGSPVISGEVDKLRAFIQAIGVDGYNTKTITITRSGGTATASCTAHGYVDKHVLTVWNADQAEYNGEHCVTWVDANTFTFPVSGSPASPATGTISAKVAPIGLTQPFTGTNKGVFLFPAGSNGAYLRIDDTNAQNSQVRGFESMSDVDTGSNPCPTIAEYALGSGPYIYKSTTANSTARAWKAWSDKKSLIIVINTDSANLWTPLLFGDYFDYKAGGVWNSHLFANIGTSVVSGTNMGGQSISPGGSSHVGGWMFRDHNGAAGAVQAGKVASYQCVQALNGNVMGNTASVTYPAEIRGGLILDKVKIASETIADGIRGEIRGLFAPGHIRPLTPGDTFSGAAGTPYAGKTFEVTQWGANGQAFIQLNDWSDDG
jgi:hypothetical protein